MILRGLASTSRIWIFLSDRLLTEEEEAQLSNELNNFVLGWQAHGVDLVASAEVLHNSIVVIGVDEHKEPPSGCSIDKAFKLLKSFGESNAIDFFNRLLLNISYCNSAKIVTREQVQELIDQKEIAGETLVFNTLAQNLGELRDTTYLSLTASWMAPKLKF
jgi:hypothetical protein